MWSFGAQQQTGQDGSGNPFQGNNQNMPAYDSQIRNSGVGWPSQTGPTESGSAQWSFGAQGGQQAGFGGFGQQATRTNIQFGSKDSAVQGAAPTSFDFGASSRQQHEQQGFQAVGFGSRQQDKKITFGTKREEKRNFGEASVTLSKRAGEEEEEAFDYEQAKREALAAMPRFAGSSGPSRKEETDHGPGAKKKIVNEEEVGKRQERAARFSIVESSRPEEKQGYDQEAEERLPGGPIVGSCEFMCPVVERERRQNMSDIQLFERVDPNVPSLTSAELAVKRFARTVDDPKPSEFRTRGALSRTMDHLRGLLDRTDVRFGLIHKFLWDRYRSVRQDLYIQGITDQFAIQIFEEIVRFHVLCEHELCADDQSVTNMEGFNSHLNMEQMNKALISLNDMYEKASQHGQQNENESEFRAYHLLSLMSQHGKFKGDQQGFLSMLQSLRPEVRDSPMVQWVLNLRSAFVFGNFAKFFILVRQAPYLLACLSHIYFPQVRAMCLKTLSETMPSNPKRGVNVEATWLCKVLLLDSQEEALNLAQQHGFESSLDDAGNASVILMKGAFIPLPTPVVRYPSRFVSSLAPGARSVCVSSIPGAFESARTQEVAPLPPSARKPDAQKAIDIAAAQEAMKQKQEMESKLAKERAEIERQRQEEMRRAAEEERLILLAKQEEALRQKELEEKKRRQEEEARRRKEEAELEAKRLLRIEEERKRAELELQRRKAAEEEARRIARLEEEKRQEEERRRKEEARRLRLIEALKKAIIMQRYWDRWLLSTKLKIEEREKAERAARNLKGCRVGVRKILRKRERDGCESDETYQMKRYQVGLRPTTISEEFPKIASVIHPIVSGKNPEISHLYWKTTVLVLDDQHTHDRASRFLYLCASQDASRIISQHHRELLFQESVQPSTTSRGLSTKLESCIEFIFGVDEKALEALESYMHGSSALCVIASNLEQTHVASLLRNKLQGMAWNGPPLPIITFTKGSQVQEECLQNGFLIRHSSWTSLDSGPGKSEFEFLAENAPLQPQFTCVSMKQAISQGIRSYLIEEEALTRAQKGGLKLLGPQAHERSIELTLQAIDQAFKSTEAQWKWPPNVFEIPLLNGWYDIQHYESMLQAVKNLYLSFKDSGMQYLSSMAMHAMMEASVPETLHLVIPNSLVHNFDRILALPGTSRSIRGAFISPPDNQLSFADRVSLDAKADASEIAANQENKRINVLKRDISSLEQEINLEKMMSSDFEKATHQLASKSVFQQQPRHNFEEQAWNTDPELKGKNSLLHKLRMIKNMFFKS